MEQKTLKLSDQNLQSALHDFINEYHFNASTSMMWNFSMFHVCESKTSCEKNCFRGDAFLRAPSLQVDKVKNPPKIF